MEFDDVSPNDDEEEEEWTDSMVDFVSMVRKLV